MDELKVAVFRLYPLEPRENVATAWKDCVRAIYEGNRKLPKYIWVYVADHDSATILTITNFKYAVFILALQC